MRHRISIQSASGSLPDSFSDTRSAPIPRAAARRVSAFAAFRKPLCKRRESKSIFRTFRKRHRLALEAGHLRVAPRRVDPITLRPNRIPEKTGMITVSLTGVIASTPITATVGNNLTYTSFQLRVHAVYLGGGDESYPYVEEHTIICVGQLTDMLRILPRDEAINVCGELRTRIHASRIGEPININIAYPFSEVVADSITWRNHTFRRVAGEDTLIALYKPDPQ